MTARIEVGKGSIGYAMEIVRAATIADIDRDRIVVQHRRQDELAFLVQ